MPASCFRLMRIGVQAWGMKAHLCGCLRLKSVLLELQLGSGAVISWAAHRLRCKRRRKMMKGGGVRKERNVQHLITLSKDKRGTSL